MKGKSKPRGPYLKADDVELLPKHPSTEIGPISGTMIRRGGRIVSVAVIIAVGVKTDGRREVLAWK